MIKSNRLSLELLDLADKKGKIQASSGNNDDLVMAFGFICYVREYMSNHLSFVDDLENEDDIVNNDISIELRKIIGKSFNFTL